MIEQRREEDASALEMAMEEAARGLEEAQSAIIEAKTRFDDA